MTIVDLKNIPAVQTNIFVRLIIPGAQTETFSDYHRNYTFGGNTYQGLGSLLSMTDINDNLRATSGEISISISGIPTANVSMILDNKIKGSRMEIYRGYFNPQTAEPIAQIPTPLAIFRGYVSNFEISDDLEGDTGSITLILTVSNFISLLGNKFAGRRTSPTDQDFFYPGDKSFDRVPALAKSNFNFGAPVK
jgi:hypothetical protein